jgi:hypothetical protein
VNILRHIRSRAFLTYLIRGDISLEEAERMTTRELAQERKRKASSSPTSSSPHDRAPGRAAGLRAELLRKLFAPSRVREPPPPRPHTADSLVDEPTRSSAATPVAVRKVEPEPAPSIIGVYAGYATGAVRIDDEFPPDLVTANWRASIEENRTRLGGRYT